MVRSTDDRGAAGHGRLALLGLTGALLSGIGDMLILGRPCSGREFDRAAGRVPAHIDPDRRWRSLWNGASLSARRIQLGTLTGHIGIGLLQWWALRGISRTLDAGPERRIAEAAATAFAVSGVLTHQCCAMVILAYQRAAALGSADGARRSPRSVTPLLAVSAAGSLGALAVLSASQTVAALRSHRSAPGWRAAVTPFPPVIAALVGFGVLPAPVGGYARPASISIGLMVYFALAAAAGRTSVRSAAC